MSIQTCWSEVNILTARLPPPLRRARAVPLRLQEELQGQPALLRLPRRGHLRGGQRRGRRGGVRGRARPRAPPQGDAGGTQEPVKHLLRQLIPTGAN